VLVQGDTTSMMATAISAFHRRIALGHIEAGLRSHDMHAPWPEELNRRVASLAARFHFAPTPRARDNLLAEGIPDARIHLTGNTIVDALHWAAHRIATSCDNKRSFEKVLHPLDPNRRTIVVTAHRRENFGDPLLNICRAIRRIAVREDVQIVVLVHPNPKVSGVICAELADVGRVMLTAPLDYEAFVYLMSRADILLTDSGGLQEEGPSLGKPVLVMRDVTERPEAVAAGTARLVGANVERIVAEVNRLLDDRDAYEAMAHVINPYGDGLAAERIRAILEQEL
jgi:UDP-N-acetylglucosamine 2-epimerase (non-hydrolysing)